MSTSTEYRLHFARAAREEIPSFIVALNDVSAIRVAVRLKLRSRFELRDGDRLVKEIAASRSNA